MESMSLVRGAGWQLSDCKRKIIVSHSLTLCSSFTSTPNPSDFQGLHLMDQSAFRKFVSPSVGYGLVDGESGVLPKYSQELPRSTLSSPQRSPKGPRPSPSAFQTLIEPARVPLPTDVNESPYAEQYGDLMENLLMDLHKTDNVDTDFQRSVPADAVTTSLMSATSASPPPFARDTRRASISSASSSHQARPSIVFQSATAIAAAPDPWVEQAQSSEQPSVMPLLDEYFESNQILRFQSTPVLLDTTYVEEEEEHSQAVEQRPVFSGNLARATFWKEEQSTMPGSDLPPQTVPAPQIPQTAHSNETMTRISSTKEDDANASNLAAALTSNLSLQQSAQFSPPESACPEPKIKAHSSENMPSLIASIPIPKVSPSPTDKSTSSSYSMPVPIGSHNSSHINLAESTTWEKVEGIRDEWQELSNPREDVMAMSESDESDLDDDEEWEASRKANAMADSAFLPSVERRRRMAAKENHAQAHGQGSATPRGKRTPTNSFAQNSNGGGGGGGNMRTGACGYEAYNLPRPNPTPSMPQQVKLNSQQEQLVAELQRARTGHGVVPNHPPINRRMVPLSSDW
ncbi:hypothetical protein CPB86DRAFT_134569 [Serendipita vermifera]|nr:hypothetical protein CPB86DRAFT_134569 [Serendipita vermifera]